MIATGADPDPDFADAGRTLARADRPPTIADSIVQRLIHNAHPFGMKGESLRQKRRKPGKEKPQSVFPDEIIRTIQHATGQTFVA